MCNRVFFSPSSKSGSWGVNSSWKKNKLRYAKFYNTLAAKMTFYFSSVREMAQSQTLLMAPVNYGNKCCHLLS